MGKLFTGNISFSQAFQPTGKQPLDVRTVVEKYSDLTSIDTWVADNVIAVYNGMTVAVIEKNQVYMLVDANNVDKVASWVVVGSKIGDNGDVDINSALEAQSAATETLKSNIEEALGYGYKSGDTVADAITAANDRIDAINEALGFGESEDEGYTGVTLLDRVSDLEDGVKDTNKRIDDLDATQVAYNPENVVLSGTNTVHKALESLVDNIIKNEETVALALTELDEREIALNDRVKALEDSTAVADAFSAATAYTSSVEAKVTTLIGNDSDKSVRTIANEELAAQLLGEDKAEDNFRTLQQLAQWLEDHPEDVAEMNAERAVLEAALAGFVNRTEKGVLVSASTVADAIKTLEKSVTATLGEGFSSASTVADAIKSIKDALGLSDDEGYTEGTLFDRVGDLEDNLDDLSATTISEVARLDATLGTGFTTAATVTDALAQAIEDAQDANDALKETIDAYTINGYALSAKTIVVKANDVTLGDEITGTTNYAATEKVSVVLQSIHAAVESANSHLNATAVEAGNGIAVTEKVNDKQTVSVNLSTDANNALSFDVNGGLFAALYYEGNDVE